MYEWRYDLKISRYVLIDKFYKLVIPVNREFYAMVFNLHNLNEIDLKERFEASVRGSYDIPASQIVSRADENLYLFTLMKSYMVMRVDRRFKKISNYTKHRLYKKNMRFVKGNKMGLKRKFDSNIKPYIEIEKISIINEKDR